MILLVDDGTVVAMLVGEAHQLSSKAPWSGVVSKDLLQRNSCCISSMQQEFFDTIWNCFSWV